MWGIAAPCGRPPPARGARSSAAAAHSACRWTPHARWHGGSSIYQFNNNKKNKKHKKKKEKKKKEGKRETGFTQRKKEIKNNKEGREQRRRQKGRIPCLAPQYAHKAALLAGHGRDLRITNLRVVALGTVAAGGVLLDHAEAAVLHLKMERMMKKDEKKGRYFRSHLGVVVDQSLNLSRRDQFIALARAIGVVLVIAARRKKVAKSLRTGRRPLSSIQPIVAGIEKRAYQAHLAVVDLQNDAQGRGIK